MSSFLKILKFFLRLFLVCKSFLNTLFNRFFLLFVLFLRLLELHSGGNLLFTSLVHSIVSFFQSLGCLGNRFTCVTAGLVLDNILNCVWFKVIRFVENWCFSDFLLSIFESEELFFFLDLDCLLCDGLGLFLGSRTVIFDFFLEMVDFIFLVLDRQICQLLQILRLFILLYFNFSNLCFFTILFFNQL